MYATSFAPRNPALRRYRYLLLAATLFTFLLMVVGTLVHTSQTGLACLAHLLRQFRASRRRCRPPANHPPRARRAGRAADVGCRWMGRRSAH
jgi:hypothetical protein